jgi:hypothetical protein
MTAKRQALARRAAVLLAVGFGTTATFYACNDSSRPVGTGPSTCTTPTTTLTVGGSGGGGTGAGGLGGSGGDAAGGNTAGGGSGGGITPAEAPCFIDGAFSTTGMAFLSPTPPDLAAALDKLTFAYLDSPRAVSVVLLASHGPPDTTLGIGATAEDGNGQAFLPGMAPTFVTAIMGYGAFRTATPQAVAWLRVLDDDGPVDIELGGVDLEAKTESQCGSIWATLDATLSDSQASTTLTIDGVVATLGELAESGAGGAPPGPVSWPIRAVFQAEAKNFDFGSL